ncbi:MAG TPA: hypothetical protein VNX88_19680 [Terriglobales bacterium]|jgi:hypothetical protein|nr:hypothetical protein [Terriglobales bacterium]
MPSQLTESEKKLRGTQQKCRIRAPRPVAKIEADIRQAEAVLGLMQVNLNLCMESIERDGLFVVLGALDSNGQLKETKRLNPAFRIQAQAVSAIRSVQKQLTLLDDELAAATAQTQDEVNGWSDFQ